MKNSFFFVLFCFVALFITFSNLAHHTYSCIGTSGKNCLNPHEGALVKTTAETIMYSFSMCSSPILNISFFSVFNSIPDILLIELELVSVCYWDVPVAHNWEFQCIVPWYNFFVAKGWGFWNFGDKWRGGWFGKQVSRGFGSLLIVAS